MIISQISAAAPGGSNEDLIAVYRQDGFTDILVMDGGSSVADRAYIDSGIGDAAWFVRSFSRALEMLVGRNISQEASVMLALKAARAEFRKRTEAISIPLYAWPIAAMTWIRATQSDNGYTLQLYCLGDCKTLLIQPDASVLDLDSYVNPQELILRDEIARLSDAGFDDPAARRERLLPILRARREYQNSTGSPSALCLDPRGRFHAREHTVGVAPGSALLGMTDGFYRLVDTYALYSAQGLAACCLRGGLEAALAELRDFEAAGADAASLTVKSADDASAVSCRFP